MIGKSLQGWFKEFGTLVFTQSIQAFIYAIIISIIMYGMKPANAGGIDTADQNAALGFISVIALTSVFKVEDMLRKLLGLGTSQASVKGAMGSIAKTAIALRMGKRVLDNGVKIGKGVAQNVKGRGELRKVNSKMEEGKLAAETAEQKAEDNYNNTSANADSNYAAKIQEIRGNNQITTRQKQAQIAQAQADRDSKKLQAGIARDDKKQAIKERYQTMHAENKAKVEEINKSRREGTKMMVSGAAEFSGSVLGGTMGGIIGGAHGDLGEATQGMLAGMGVGDAVGQATVETASAGLEASRSISKYTEDYFKDVNKRAMKIASSTGANPSMIKGMIDRSQRQQTKRTKELLDEFKARADDAN